jgi:uncharacterized membrane protein
MLFHHPGAHGTSERALQVLSVACASWVQLGLVGAALLFALALPGDTEVTIIKVLVFGVAVLYLCTTCRRRLRDVDEGRILHD